MKPSNVSAVSGLALVLLSLLAGCASDPDRPPPKNPFRPNDSQQEQSRREQKLAADKLYRLARSSLDVGDYSQAILHYDQLIQRHPFTEFASQAEMERVFAQFRNYQDEQALSSADRFLRDHPRHANADYVQYLRGLVNARHDEGLLDGLPGMDPSQGDVAYSRRSFDDFALLIQKYPNSRYNADARLRMIDLRNRIARHEYTVVDFYMRRGAWLAAARRAERIVSDYPGAPGTREALAALEKCYGELGLTQQAENVRKLREAQPKTAS